MVRYHSASDGPILAERQYRFAHFLPEPATVPYLSAIDTDSKGNVYVVDKFTHKIIVLSSDLDERLKEYGVFGYGQGEFNYPLDIYIDNLDNKEEMHIFERWQENSGIQSFRLVQGLRKGTISDNLPSRFCLYQNFPNPFNSSTTIQFDLPKAGAVKIEVFNILGQRVKTLINDYKSPGHHLVVWNGENESGDAIASGIYLYRIETTNNSDVKKLLLLK